MVLPFKSFVVLDLETTNLINPHITEICVVAIERDHIEYGSSRVVHKLSLCVKPNGKVHPTVTSLTGLDNELLSNLEPMNDNVFSCLNSFLIHIPHPICLVAHNGFNFDFPILKKEMKNIERLCIDDLYVVDSIPAFREILGRKRAKSPIRSPPIHRLLKDEEEDEMCCQALLAYEIEAMDLDSCLPKSQELTPKTRNNAKPITPRKEKQAIDLHEMPARRKLSFDEESSQPDFETRTPPVIISKPKSFKLSDIYEFLIKEPMVNAHRAEADCEALLQCISAVAPAFCAYTDKNARLFSSIQPAV